METDFSQNFLIYPNRSKFGRPALLLLALEALEAVRAANNGALPALGSSGDELFAEAAKINAARPEDKRIDSEVCMLIDDDDDDDDDDDYYYFYY